MAYVKNTWVDREGQTRYHETIDDDGALIFTPDYEKVTEIGTPVNADNMNHIEEGIEDHENRITVLEEGGDASNFLNKSQITNCLLEVPQNIKLELNDGTLTLKAGSKVIVPNGAGVFEEVVISSDIRRTMGSATLGEVFIYVKNGLAGSAYLGERSISRSTSGTTNPATTQALWYDTTNNKVMSSISDTTFTDDCSFPVAIVNYITRTIVQVFNGFGYIGSTVWVDKGVKGLIPNGRNEDGSLRNTEITTSKVLTRTFANTENFKNAVLGLTATSIGRLNEKSYSFDYEKNYIDNTGATDPWMHVVVGTLDETNGVISNFQPKLPVRLLTYDDIKINNPYFFGQYIWSEFAPDNLSWLKSSGQWNSGSGYQAFYDWALANANANKAGFKLSTASYTDYDFVVNTSAKTFRLPVKVQNTPVALSDTVPVGGNGNSLGLMAVNTLGTALSATNSKTFGLILDNGSSHNYEMFRIGAYNVPLSTAATGSTVAAPDNAPIGVTTDASASGLVADLSNSANTNVSLYFYVGETVKDPTLINMAQIASNFADKIGRTECKAYITQTYVSGTSWYRVYSDGWCEQGGRIASGTTSGVVALLKPYASTNYDVIVAPSSTGDYYTANIAGWANSKTQFGWNSYNNSVTPKIWRTYGYIN